MVSSRTPQVSRRTLIALFGAAGIAAATTSCAGPGSTTTPKSTGLDLSGEATGEVSFAHWRAEDKKVFDELIAKFQKEFPDITVDQNISTSTDYQAQALQRLRQGKIGDVAPAFRGAQFTSFVDAGLFVPLDDTGLSDSYKSQLIESGASGGKQYGYPYQLVFLDPIANMDALSDAGYDASPEDWDSYIDMLDKLKTNGLIPIAFPGADAGNAGQIFNPMIMNIAPSDDMCTKIEAGEYKCTDDWFVEMLRRYQQLGEYVQPDAAGTAAEPAQQMFATGKAALLSTGSYHVASARDLGAEFPINLAPPITSDKGEAKYLASYNATFILGINSASKVQPAALEWLKYLSTPEVASEYANGTAQFSPVKGVEYENEDLAVLQPWLDKKTLLAPRYQFNNLDMRNAVEASCVDALTGTKPEKAAEDAQKIVDQLVAAS